MNVYCNTSNKRPWHLLERELQNPGRLSEHCSQAPGCYML